MMNKPTPRSNALMVLGTSSGAGKSWLATALCRWYAQRGLKVAPFKAQNMSNNARLAHGLNGRAGEIGSAQYFQALAARAEPEVSMNPVLLKPESDTSSQFVLMGQVNHEIGRLAWRERSAAVWPSVRGALHELQSRHDLIIIEGAGSPAEINLAASDFVNIRTAVAANARCLMVCDIDRGGAFAHLFGTHALMPDEGRSLVDGFVLNKFRGDATLLAPAPEMLQARTGVPTVAVLPMWRNHGLPEEDGVFDDSPSPVTELTRARIAIIAYPRISNLDEFEPLRTMPTVSLRWAREPADLLDCDWVVLPGTKHTHSDLHWLRAQGLDIAIKNHAAAGKPVLGICGGLQMLGTALHDPHGVESTAGSKSAGLSLLPITTAFAYDKQLTRVLTQFSNPTSHFAVLKGITFEGYEIHHGASQVATADDCVLQDTNGQAIGWQRGSVMGVYAHGMFESASVQQALFGSQAPGLEPVFDAMATYLDQHFEPGFLERFACLS